MKISGNAKKSRLPLSMRNKTGIDEKLNNKSCAFSPVFVGPRSTKKKELARKAVNKNPNASENSFRKSYALSTSAISPPDMRDKAAWEKPSANGA